MWNLSASGLASSAALSAWAPQIFAEVETLLSDEVMTSSRFALAKLFHIRASPKRCETQQFSGLLALELHGTGASGRLKREAISGMRIVFSLLCLKASMRRSFVLPQVERSSRDPCECD